MCRSLSLLILLGLAAMPALAEDAPQTADTLAANTLHEVVVTGTRHAVDARQLPMTVTVIDRAALTDKGVDNVLPTITDKVPGVFVTSRGVMGYDVTSGAAGGINIRGLGGGDGRVMVLVDGHPQYNGVYSHPISDSYQTMMAERVEVVRSPASVLYGSNAMGGVINIVTDRKASRGTHGRVDLTSGSFNSIETGASVSHNNGKVSAMLAGSYRRSDNHRPNMDFEQYGGYAEVGCRFSERWDARLSADVTHFNSTYPGTESRPMLEALRWITRGVAQLSVTNDYGKATGGFGAYCNFGNHKVNDGYAAQGGKPQTEYFRSHDALAGFNLWETFHFFRGNHVTFGLDYQHIYGRAFYTNRETGEVVTTGRRGMQSAHGHANEWAGYVDIRQELGAAVTLNAGLRYDHHSVAGGQLVPMGGVAVRPNAWSQLKALVSKGFRNPTYKELYMYGTANSELKAENIMSYELAWRQQLDHVSYGLNAYYLNGSNMITTGTVVDANGNEVTRNINTGPVENWGVEAELEWSPMRSLTLSTNHTWLHMVHAIVGAPQYKGVLAADWHHGRWSAGLQLMQISGLYLTTERTSHATLLQANAAYRPTKFLRLWVRGDNLLAQRYQLIDGLPMPRATVMAGVNVTI